MNGDDGNLITMGMIHFENDVKNYDVVDQEYWQNTLTAYECSYDLCARAYSNWTSVNGTVMPGTTQESPLHLSGPGLMIPYNAVEEEFPGNRTFTINHFDVDSIISALVTIYGNKDGSAIENSFTVALYNSPNISRTVENIATGMSYRMLSGPNATTVLGGVIAVQTYIRIRWPWLLLMAVLEIFTCLLLTLVIVATSRERQRPWKSSLAPLLHDGVMKQ